jgi:hypothetical protein
MVERKKQVFLIETRETLFVGTTSECAAFTEKYSGDPSTIATIDKYTDGKQVIEMTVSTLFTIYSAAFNHGVNDGPFPTVGIMEALERLLHDQSIMGDGSRYALRENITFK